MNLDLLGTRIRVTSIDPGMVKTNFSLVRFAGDAARAEAFYEGIDALSAKDIADTILYAVEAPDHVNIQDILIMPTAQRSVSAVHREKK